MPRFKDPDSIAALCVQLSRLFDPREPDSIEALQSDAFKYMPGGNPSLDTATKQAEGQAVQAALQLVETVLTDVHSIAASLRTIASAQAKLASIKVVLR